MKKLGQQEYVNWTGQGRGIFLKPDVCFSLSENLGPFLSSINLKLSGICMSSLGAIVDNIERRITLSERTRSLDPSLIHDNNDNTKLTNGEVCLTSETTNFRIGDLLLPNGESYSGSLLGNIPEGYGKYRWSDGCRYEGEWRHGITHGHGKLEFPSCDVYDGEFSGGYMHGEGTYIEPDKVTYRGRWRLNLKRGLGYQMYPNGDIFEGSWIQGTPEGPGKCMDEWECLLWKHERRENIRERNSHLPGYPPNWASCTSFLLLDFFAASIAYTCIQEYYS